MYIHIIQWMSGEVTHSLYSSINRGNTVISYNEWSSHSFIFIVQLTEVTLSLVIMSDQVTHSLYSSINRGNTVISYNEW